MIPKYAVLEAKDNDSVCPIMIVEGQYEGTVLTFDVVKISEDGVLSFNYNVMEGDATGSEFENTLGDILVNMIEEKVFDDDRNEYS
jgi:hypothetical protein|tara:strand:+ start:7502 stop:7759 length:258 start_codon:yes stop_codon:yes gene_type:complete